MRTHVAGGANAFELVDALAESPMTIAKGDRECKLMNE